MNSIDQFIAYLISQKCSPATVKNYRADIKAFIRWYEKTFKKTFIPQNVSIAVIEAYKNIKTDSESGISKRSAQRHISSLRKFFHCLEIKKIIDSNPFNIKEAESKDPWHLEEFKVFLASSKSSELTIKNYILDVKQFLAWYAKENQETLELVDPLMTLDYKLLADFQSNLEVSHLLSPASINRKLSSLRKYFAWVVLQGYTPQTKHKLVQKETISITPSHPSVSASFVSLPKIGPSIVSNILFDHKKVPESENIVTEPKPQAIQPTYSRFPPLRLAQKLFKLQTLVLDSTLILPLANVVEKLQILLWYVKGKPLFNSSKEMLKELGYINSPNDRQKYIVNQNSGLLKIDQGSKTDELYDLAKNPFKGANRGNFIQNNLSKNIISGQRITISRYFQAAALIIFVAVLGIIAYKKFIETPKSKPSLAAEIVNNKILSFHGTLTNAAGDPLTGTQTILFKLYNDPLKDSQSVGSGSLLWEEERQVNPDANGNFSVNLGSSENLPNVPAPLCGSIVKSVCGIPKSIFTENTQLWLGVTVGSDAELTPRQQIPTISYAGNSQTVEGLLPITDANVTGNSNALLALNSNGSVVIPGTATTTFQSLHGNLKLTGNTLVLSTNFGSNGNLVLSPDGSGVINVQRPLNGTNSIGSIQDQFGNVVDNNAVEIDGMAAILATTSGQAALLINQTGNGPLLTASVSGVTKFLVTNTGSIGIGGAPRSRLDVAFDPGTSATAVIFGARTLNSPASGGVYVGINASPSFSGNFLQFQTGYLNKFSVKSDGTILSAVGIANGSSPNNAYVNTAPYGTTIGRNISDAHPALIIQQANNLSTGDILELKNATATVVTVNQAGQVGIGTITPRTALDVLSGSFATSSAIIENTSSETAISGLAIKLDSSSLNNTSHFINYLNKNGETIGSVQSNSLGNGITYATSGIADFSEYVAKESTEQIPWGTIVCEFADGKVHPCSGDSADVLGVASQNPSFVGGKNLGDASLPVDFSGQIYTRVSTQNGAIAAGDMISVGTDGVGVKAKDAGVVVGKAMQGFNGSGEGSIIVLVGPQWYDPQVYLTDTGGLNIDAYTVSLPKGIAPAYPSAISHTFSVLDAQGNPLSRIAAFSSAVIGNLKTGGVTAGQIATSALNVTSDSVTIAGKSLSDYINSVIDQRFAAGIISPITQIDQVKTNIISPLAQNSSVQIALGDSQISIVNSQTQKTVAAIDNSGNATFAGTLNSQNLTVNQDASISGTLHAHRIVADQIDGLSSNSATIVNNYYNSTSSAAQTLASTQLQTNNTDLASFSGQLNNIQNLAAVSVTLQNGLTAYGPSSLADTSVAGQLFVDTNMVLSSGSINVLGQDLQLQPLKQGGIDFEGGLIAIDTQGNLTVNGDANFMQDVTVHGRLAAGIISPLGDGDLNIQLVDDKNLNVKTASGSSILTVNQNGDVQASGSGNFAQLLTGSLNIVRSAQADTSVTQTVATSSAGTATILPGQTERTIISPFVKTDSLIYVTPTSDTYGAAPYIARQSDNSDGTPAQFTIQISNPITKPITLNWWIVN